MLRFTSPSICRVQVICTRRRQKQQRLQWKAALPASITCWPTTLGHNSPTLTNYLTPITGLHWATSSVCTRGIMSISIIPHLPMRNVRLVLFAILRHLLRLLVSCRCRTSALVFFIGVFSSSSECLPASWHFTMPNKSNLALERNSAVEILVRLSGTFWHHFSNLASVWH